MASQVLKEAGWPDSVIPDALGVITAESGRRADARNPRPCSPKGDHAIGWFQVCMVHAGSCGIPNLGSSGIQVKAGENWLKNPKNNSKAALCIYQGAGNTFGRDWSTWKTGKAQLHRGQDFSVNYHEAPLSGAADTVTGAVTGPIDAVKDAAGVLGDIAGGLLNPKTWIRAGEGFLGGVLLLSGVVALGWMAANKAAKSPVGQVASNAVPAGKLAKAGSSAGKAVWGKV